MKNKDYIVYVTTGRGRTWRYVKDKDGWKQIGPEGQTHRMTADQLLNHLLPAFANIKPLTARVVYKRKKSWIRKSPGLD